VTRTPNQRVTDIGSALVTRRDFGNSGIDDRVTRAATPIARRRERELRLVTVGAGTREVRVASLVSWRAAVDVLNEIREALREVHGAQPDRLCPRARRQPYLCRSSLFRPQIRTSNCIQRRPKLIERGGVERGAQGSAEPQNGKNSCVRPDPVGGESMVVRIVIYSPAQRI